MSARWLRILLLLAACALASGSARADNCTAAMSDIVFGQVSPVDGGDYFANGTLTVTCNWTLLGNLGVLLLPNVNICVNAGAGSGGTSVTTRAMENGSARLAYNLYRDSTYAASSVWGSTAQTGTQPITTRMGGLLALGALSQTFTVYARIPASALSGVPSSGGADTTYVADFSGHGAIRYAFFGLLAPAADCKTGASAAFSFKVRATVTNNCYINADTLAFGANNRVLTSAVRTVGTISVQCTANNPYSIALNGGSVSGKPAARRMRNAATGETIGYEISGTLDGPLWGDGTAGTSVVTGTGSGATQSVKMYGRVPAQRTPTPGNYRDTVTATIYF